MQSSLTMTDLCLQDDEHRSTGCLTQIAEMKRNAMKIIHISSKISIYVCIVVMTRSNVSRAGSEHLADVIYPVLFCPNRSLRNVYLWDCLLVPYLNKIFQIRTWRERFGFCNNSVIFQKEVHIHLVTWWQLQ